MSKKPNIMRIVRFFTNGGHDGGDGRLGHIAGEDVIVSAGRLEELAKDLRPMNTLRSPYGHPEGFGGANAQSDN